MDQSAMIEILDRPRTLYCDDVGLVFVIPARCAHLYGSWRAPKQGPVVVFVAWIRLSQGGVTEHTLAPRARLELQRQLGAGTTEFAGNVTPSPKKSLASSLHTRATLEDKPGLVTQGPFAACRVSSGPLFRKLCPSAQLYPPVCKIFSICSRLFL
jgi:hypothetical protein